MGFEAMQRCGLEVQGASSAEEMEAALEASRFDAAMLDLLVGDADALRLRTVLRASPHGQEIPVFVMSDFVDHGLLLQVFRDEASDFLVKPINWMVVPHRIRQVLANTHTVRQLHREQVSLQEAIQTAQSASTEALRLRNYDTLTGLPNRTMFTEMLTLAATQTRHRGGEVAVLCLDLDSFREVNDTLGRRGGDETLRAVAGRLQHFLADFSRRTGADFAGLSSPVARLHGDEFAALLGGVEGPEAAEKTARELAARLHEPFMVLGREVFLSVSIGIAMSSDDHGDTLLQCAEIAMRHAKGDKHGPCCFYRDFMRNQVVEKLELQRGLRRALGNGELRLFYQPMVNARSGWIESVEGLLRWQHPERGAIPPGQFIPVAEESGLMVPIGDWVISHGCHQLKDWIDQGLPSIRMALNVAHRQLEQESFVSQVEKTLRETGLDPGLLELELSERGVLRDDAATVAKLKRLDELGVALAIDDFGTGQTTLDYLRKFPLKVLKIDRSFVKSIASDPATAAITGAMVAMSHSLHLKVVGEGVESRDQAAILADQSCDLFQGFLYHEPMPAGELATLLRTEARKRTAAEKSQRAAKASGPMDDAEAVTAAEGVLPREAEEKLVRMAHLDYLTGVLNRYSLERRLDTALARAERFGHNLALIVFDLDDFKEVNDNYGHDAGDEVLRTVAERINREVRRVDAFARLGGDEFALVHSGFERLDGVAKWVGRMGARISQPVRHEGRELSVTASFGIAVYPPGANDPRRLYKQADLALYQAKKSGGDTFRFHVKKMDDQVQERLTLSREVQGALQRDELFLEYQPQLTLDTRRLVGIEALLRWRHPERGLIPPAEFVPVAESSGDMVRIGEWVLRTACRQARTWVEEHGRDLNLCVNLSWVQSRVPGFPQLLERILAEVGLDPGRLELELDQMLIARAGPELDRLLVALTEIGVRLSLDDFGSAEISLDRLVELPFDKVKVDQRFVQSIDSSNGCPPPVAALIALAKKLGMEVVAEGVETLGQLEALIAEGCDYGQGHVFTRPLSVAALSTALRRGDIHRGSPEGEEVDGRVIPFPASLER